MKVQNTRLYWVVAGLVATAPALPAPLHDAARSGNLDRTRQLIIAGADVNNENRNGLTPLLLAMSNGHGDIERMLRRNGARNVISAESLTRLQTFLRVLGHDPGSIDGLLGPATRDAIRAYQQQSGLPVTGGLSEDWIVRLNRDMVQQIQARLQQLGYDPGPPDGLLGPGTRDAIRAFQRKENLPLNKEISEDWLSRLFALTTEQPQQQAPAAADSQTAAKPKLTVEATAGAATDMPAEPAAEVAAAESAAATGEEWVEIQKRLQLLGYYKGKADGVMGAGTERAIRAFQQANQLPVTGKISADWLVQLDYRVLQKTREQLQALGYSASEIFVQPGPETEQMIRSVQTQLQLPVTGRFTDDWPAQLAAKRVAAEPQQLEQADVQTAQPDSDLAARFRAEPDKTHVDPELIKEIQTRLQTLGYASGVADGYLGPDTRGAIRKFQQRIDWPVDGRVSAGWLPYLESERIKLTQALLRDLGYRIDSVAGEPDDATWKALRAVQQQYGGLSLDEIDDAVVRRLREVRAERDRREAERLSGVQRQLQVLGFDPGPIDGTLGPSTQTAIRAFQRQMGLPANGQLSRATLERMENELVRNVQGRLTTLGYEPGPVDGHFGPGTRKAVQTFLQKASLSIDGQPGVELLTSLDQAIAEQAAAAERERQAAAQAAAAKQQALVKDIQRLLTELDYDPGPVDGAIGARTVDAIRRFQRQVDVAADGKASQALLKRLQDARKARLAAQEERRRRAEERERQLAAERERQTIERAKIAAQPSVSPQLTENVQASLKALGYNIGSVDGKLGSKTEAAIRQFQRRNELTPDGKPSATLLAKLDELINRNKEAAVERDIQTLGNATARVSSDKILEIQRYLTVLGHDPGRTDGRLGSRTQGAIRAFQAQNSLPVTGEATEELYTEIKQLANARQAGIPAPTNERRNAEVTGKLRFQRSSNGELLGCAVQNVQLDVSWCSSFVNRGKTDDCKVVLRPDSKVLFVKCV